MKQWLANLYRIPVAKVKWRFDSKYSETRAKIQRHTFEGSLWTKKHGHLMPVFMTSFKPVTIKSDKPRSTKGIEYTVKMSTSLYESPVAIRILVKPTGYPAKAKYNPSLGVLKLAFEGSTITMLPQGIKGTQGVASIFATTTGIKWPNYLIQMTEKLAKKLGFKELRIPVPETLRWYKDPVYSDAEPEVKEKTQSQMKAFFEKVAAAEGYKLNERGDFFVKKIG